MYNGELPALMGPPQVPKQYGMMVPFPKPEPEYRPDPKPNLLVVVLDTNPAQKVVRDDGVEMTKILDSVISFSNSHLMQDSHNKLAIFACHSMSSHFIYPGNKKPEHVSQVDGQLDDFQILEKTVKRNLALLTALELSKSSLNNESLLAGTISMALCYIARIQRMHAGKLNSRILLVTGSGDSNAQYLNYMNVFFAAKKVNVLIDVCSLNQDLTILQQGCDISKGIYLKVPLTRIIDGLIQILLWVFLPDASQRQVFHLPPKFNADYRTECFCHKSYITIGYVCSDCLTVYCQFTPICTTCEAVFKLPWKIESVGKKRRLAFEI